MLIVCVVDLMEINIPITQSIFSTLLPSHSPRYDLARVCLTQLLLFHSPRHGLREYDVYGKARI